MESTHAADKIRGQYGQTVPENIETCFMNVISLIAKVHELFLGLSLKQAHWAGKWKTHVCSQEALNLHMRKRIATGCFQAGRRGEKMSGEVHNRMRHSGVWVHSSDSHRPDQIKTNGGRQAKTSWNAAAKMNGKQTPGASGRALGTMPFDISMSHPQKGGIRQDDKGNRVVTRTHADGFLSPTAYRLALTCGYGETLKGVALNTEGGSLMFLVTSQPNVGKPANTYSVDLGKQIFCTCLSFPKVQQCKHSLFVLALMLQVTADCPILYNWCLTPGELTFLKSAKVVAVRKEDAPADVILTGEIEEVSGACPYVPVACIKLMPVLPCRLRTSACATRRTHNFL